MALSSHVSVLAVKSIATRDVLRARGESQEMEYMREFPSNDRIVSRIARYVYWVMTIRNLPDFANSKDSETDSIYSGI